MRAEGWVYILGEEFGVPVPVLRPVRVVAHSFIGLTCKKSSSVQPLNTIGLFQSLYTALGPLQGMILRLCLIGDHRSHT